MTTLDLTAGRGEASHSDRLAHWTRVLCVLFFFSGFPALIYQLVWQRALFRIFGVNIESVTIVVTAFMLGLGLGSLAGGWLSKRRGTPLLPLLAVIELMTAAFGLFSLAMFERVGTLAAGLPLPVTALVALALVIMPTLLMGATLPVLLGHLVSRSGNVGSTVGLLYYVNTLGAGTACIVCAILLFPIVGMQGAVNVAAAINLAVAAGAIWMHRRRVESAASMEASGSVAPSSPILGFAAVLALAGVGGFVSLSYEIFLFRTVSYASGSSASSFAATLSAFLIGIASGSRQAGHVCRTTSPQEAMRRCIQCLMLAILLGFLFLPVLGQLSFLGGGIVFAAMLMVYLLAHCWGALLPYLAHLGVAADGASGMRTALLYFVNIVGSAAGCIATGFMLMDRLSLAGIAAVLVVAGALCAALLIAALPLPARDKLMRAGGVVGFGILAVIAMPALSADVLERLQWKGADIDKRFVQVVENRSGIITVDKDGAVFGNGMYDGRFSTDLVHDVNGIVRPYALSLFHAAPRDVLMIGLSSGSWAQVIANNPAVASLTIVEINPGYRQLVAQTPEVASLLFNPKVTIVTDDGRRWLRLNARRFDAIVSNTTWHFRANVTNLLSREFLDVVKDHLNPNGIFFYNTTDSDRAQRTGCVVFAHGARFTNHMVVSNSPIAWDFRRWRRTLEAYRIDGQAKFDPARAEHRALLDDLTSWEASLAPDGGRNKRPIEPCPDVLARTAAKSIVTDDNMGSEWRYSLGLE